MNSASRDQTLKPQQKKGKQGKRLTLMQRLVIGKQLVQSESTSRDRSLRRYQQLFRDFSREGGDPIKLLEGGSIHEPIQGRRPIVPHSLRDQLRTEIEGYRTEGRRVTSRTTRTVATRIMQEHGLEVSISTDYAQRFNTKSGLVKRKITTGHLHNQSDMLQMKQKFILGVRDDYDVSNELIFNMDELAVWLTPQSSWTMAKRGAASVPAIGSEDKRCVTAMVTSSAAGHVLMGTLIWKGGSDSCHVQRPPSDTKPVLQVHSESKWSTPKNVVAHITHCILPEIFKICQSKRGYAPKSPDEYPVSVLHLDSWSSHRDQIVKELCQRHNIRLREIPPNYTDLLQPNDQIVNAQIKASLVNSFDDHMLLLTKLCPSNTSLSLTYLKPLVLEWFYDALANVSEAQVRRSWGNATDGVLPRGDCLKIPAIEGALSATCCQCLKCWLEDILYKPVPKLLQPCRCCERVWAFHVVPAVVALPQMKTKNANLQGIPNGEVRRRVTQALKRKSPRTPGQPPPKKRGRPRKNPEVSAPQAPGQPPPKKRGRPPNNPEVSAQPPSEPLLRRSSLRRT
jgi:hypothetical protein